MKGPERVQLRVWLQNTERKNSHTRWFLTLTVAENRATPACPFRYREVTAASTAPASIQDRDGGKLRSGSGANVIGRFPRLLQLISGTG